MNKEENTLVKYNNKITINIEEAEELKPEEKRKSPFHADFSYNCKTTVFIKNAQHEILAQKVIEPGKERDILDNYITRIVVKGSIAGRGYYIDAESEDGKFNKTFYYMLK